MQTFNTFPNTGEALISISAKGISAQLMLSKAVRGQYHVEEGTRIYLNADKGTAQVIPVAHAWRYPKAEHIVCMLSVADVNHYIDHVTKTKDLYGSLALLDTL